MEAFEVASLLVILRLILLHCLESILELFVGHISEVLAVVESHLSFLVFALPRPSFVADLAISLAFILSALISCFILSYFLPDFVRKKRMGHFLRFRGSLVLVELRCEEILVFDLGCNLAVRVIGFKEGDWDFLLEQAVRGVLNPELLVVLME